MTKITEKSTTSSTNSPTKEGCPKGRVVRRKAKDYFSLPYYSILKDRAKALRKAGILVEVLFWQQVHKRKFKGYDFDRQKLLETIL